MGEAHLENLTDQVSMQMLLLDSSQKRCKFVEQVAQHLQIQNTNVLWSRAETAGRDPKTREVQHFLVTVCSVSK